MYSEEGGPNCLPFFYAVFTTAVISSCATKARYQPSYVVPAAEGNVKVKKDENNDYRLKIEVQNLVEPSRLPQPQIVYEVAAETPQGSQNL